MSADILREALIALEKAKRAVRTHIDQNVQELVRVGVVRVIIAPHVRRDVEEAVYGPDSSKLPRD